MKLDMRMNAFLMVAMLMPLKTLAQSARSESSSECEGVEVAFALALAKDIRSMDGMAKLNVLRKLHDVPVESRERVVLCLASLSREEDATAVMVLAINPSYTPMTERLRAVVKRALNSKSSYASLKALAIVRGDASGIETYRKEILSMLLAEKDSHRVAALKAVLLLPDAEKILERYVAAGKRGLGQPDRSSVDVARLALKAVVEQRRAQESRER